MLTTPLLAWIDGDRIMWLSISAGIGLLALGMGALLITRWGQSRPLRKCIALSVWTHFLLGLYALTIEIVPRPGHPQGAAIRVAAVDQIVDDSMERDETADDREPTEKSLQPWEQFSTTSLRPMNVPTAPKVASDAPSTASATTPPNVTPTIPAALPELAPLMPRVAANVKLPAISPPRPVTSEFQRPVGDMSVPTASIPKPSIDPDAGPQPASPPRMSSEAFTDAALERLLNVSPKPSVPVAMTGSLSNSKPTIAGDHRPPELYERRNAPDRGKFAAMQGGSVDTEAAVTSALKWLATNQSRDGRWDASQFGAGREAKILGHDRGGAGTEADTGITGLALLAFLGAGHTHLKGEHAQVVRNGFDYLIRWQAADGNLGGEADTYAFMYCHGMAALAMSEAYGMTGDERLRYPVSRAVAYTISCQNRTTGGWRYRAGETGDTSQLGWQLMLLKSAELGGIDVPSDSRRLAKQFINSVSTGKSGGLAGYRPQEKVTHTMTAEALMCRQFMGLKRNDPLCDEAGDYLLDEKPGSSQTNFYYWYYATLSIYQLQGKHWNDWNSALTKTLVGSQYRAGPLAGSWDPDPVWGSYGGRVYSTALGALCLEVYYRFLPLYGGGEK